MPKIEIGAGFVLAALASVGFLGDLPTTVILLVFGILLILHGSYEEFFKPRVFLESRIVRWLSERHWRVRTDPAAKSRFGFYFAIWAEDDSRLPVAITRDKASRNVLAFSAKVPLDDTWLSALNNLSSGDQRRLVEDIHIMLATKNIAFLNLTWPLDKLAVQTAEPLDQVLSEHKVDVTAKEILHAMFGARSIIRRAIAE